MTTLPESISDGFSGHEGHHEALHTVYNKTLAEGDLIVGDGAQAFRRVAIGANQSVLTADSAVAGKVRWAALNGSPLLNVKDYPYLAEGDGTTDDTAAIQAALDEARTGDGGVVLVPPGDYLVNLAVHPVSGSYHAALTIGSDTTLFLLPGARIFLDANQSFGTNTCAIVMNRAIVAGDTNIAFYGGVYDGNGANQTLTQSGIFLIKTTGVRHQNVEVRNCKGTATSGANETFHFETQSGSDTDYVNCRAIRTAGTTSSGFSTNDHQSTRYFGCIAKGMTVTNGFTHYGCRDVTYVGCRSHDNATHGFNSEHSVNATYLGCTSGGVSLSTGNYPYSGSENLGNGSEGFVCLGTTNMQLIGCAGEANGGNGAQFQDDGGDPATGRIVGGSFSANTIGVAFLGNAAKAVTIDVRPVTVGNSSSAYNAPAPAGAFDTTVTAPAMPATGVAVTNPFPFACMVYVTGAIDYMQLGPINVGAQKAVRVRAGGSTVTPNFSSTPPTWEWVPA